MIFRKQGKEGVFLSLVNHVSSKEQKVSEFRQEWINALREDLSIFFSSSRALCRTMQETRSPGSDEDDIQNFKFGKEKTGHMRLAGADAYYRVKLRLNKGEAEHKELLRLLESTIEIQNKINLDKKGLDYTEALDAIERTSNYSQDILKSEWERVKTGEPTYRYSKNFAYAVLFIGLVIACLTAYVILSSKLSANENKTTASKSINVEGVLQPFDLKLNKTQLRNYLITKSSADESFAWVTKFMKVFDVLEKTLDKKYIRVYGNEM